MARLALVTTVAVALAATLAVGCGGGSGELSAGSGSGLEGQTFLSESITQDGRDRPLVVGSRISLSFEDGRVRASAGCNSMSGGYTVDGEVLDVADLASTMMGCDPERMDQDQWFSGFLSGAPIIVLDGDELTLSRDGVVITLRNSETVTPDRELTDGRWELESIIEGGDENGTVSSVATVAWIEFAVDGTLETNLGCNTVGGSYSVDGDTLVVDELSSGVAECMGDALATEQSMRATLEARPGYTIDADRLSLRTKSGGLDFLVRSS